MINVFNIERFATHDGDGIRTVVFLKGCMLRCPWCSNPESWETEPELAYDAKKCSGCRECEKNCTSGAIYFKDGCFHYNRTAGDLCEKSVEHCPTGALEIIGKTMTIPEILEVVMKDVDYYRNSGGGVTISGGEPLFQYDALLSLMKACKENDLNTALETTGNTQIENIKEIEPYVDTFLFDIKQLDPVKLKKVVGADQEKIMENFLYLTQICPQKVVMRVPVIPGFNNTDDFLQQVLNLGKRTRVREINLLPYHHFGRNKWTLLMKDYLVTEDMIDKAELLPYQEKGNEMGLHVKIGG